MQGGRGRGNRDEAGGGDGLSGIDPLCAHCAERSGPAPYPWQPFVVQPNCLSYISCTFEDDLHCKRQWTESQTPAMVPPSVRGS